MADDFCQRSIAVGPHAGHCLRGQQQEEGGGAHMCESQPLHAALWKDEQHVLQPNHEIIDTLLLLWFQAHLVFHSVCV